MKIPGIGRGGEQKFSEGVGLSQERKIGPASSAAAQPASAPTALNRQSGDGLKTTCVESSSASELHVTVTPRPSESATALVRRLAETLNARNATVVRQIVFGSLKEARRTAVALCQAFEDPDLPVTWVEGAACDGGAIAGIQVHAVSGVEVRSAGRGVRVWDDAHATHCVLNGLGPRQTGVSAREQARETLENLQAGLSLAGMTIKDVARTWFFLDGILGWYGDFNQARNAFFEQCELRAGHFPASTGVGARNPAGAALTTAAWAIRPHDETKHVVRFAPSSRQCPACSYGSAFSRAAEVHSEGLRQVLVSGTASIAPDGSTAHAGDVRGQIELSMDVVESILTSRGMDLSDVSRATAYFKSPTDVRFFGEWLLSHGLNEMPVVNAVCDICRDDLLFEIELDAIKA